MRACHPILAAPADAKCSDDITGSCFIKRWSSFHVSIGTVTKKCMADADAGGQCSKKRKHDHEIKRPVIERCFAYIPHSTHLATISCHMRLFFLINPMSSSRVDRGKRKIHKKREKTLEGKGENPGRDKIENDRLETAGKWAVTTFSSANGGRSYNYCPPSA